MCNAFFFCEHHSYLMRNVNPMSPPRNAYVTKKKRRGNNKSHRLIEKWERRCVGEERTVLCPPCSVEWEGRRGMKRGEKRLLDFLFFFWRWDFFKIRGSKRLLNFLFCQYCAKKSGASVCVGVCEEFVLYEEEEEEEVCKRFGVDEVIVCKE